MLMKINIFSFLFIKYAMYKANPILISTDGSDADVGAAGAFGIRDC